MAKRKATKRSSPTSRAAARARRVHKGGAPVHKTADRSPSDHAGVNNPQPQTAGSSPVPGPIPGGPGVTLWPGRAADARRLGIGRCGECGAFEGEEHAANCFSGATAPNLGGNPDVNISAQPGGPVLGAETNRPAGVPAVEPLLPGPITQEQYLRILRSGAPAGYEAIAFRDPKRGDAENTSYELRARPTGSSDQALEEWQAKTRHLTTPPALMQALRAAEEGEAKGKASRETPTMLVDHAAGAINRDDVTFRSFRWRAKDKIEIMALDVDRRAGEDWMAFLVRSETEARELGWPGLGAVPIANAVKAEIAKHVPAGIFRTEDEVYKLQREALDAAKLGHAEDARRDHDAFAARQPEIEFSSRFKWVIAIALAGVACLALAWWMTR